MIQFNNLQEGLKFAFNGYKFHIISVSGNQDPYFVGPELVPIFNVKDSSYITRYLSNFEYLVIDYDQIKKLNIDPPDNGGSISSRGGARFISLISLGGVFALCNRLYNRNPNVAKFADYINHVILPTLWNNPQIITQINGLYDQNMKLQQRNEELLQMNKMNYNGRIEAQVQNMNLRKENKELINYKNENEAFNDLGRAVYTNGDSITVNQFAKLLSSNLQKSIGDHKVTAILMANGYLMKDVRNLNTPTQFSLNNGYMAVGIDNNGKYYTVITPKGVDHLLKLFKNINLY